MVYSKRLATVIAFLVFAAPAIAKDWIPRGGGYWIDRDSIRRDGSLVFYDSTWVDLARGPPDDSHSGVNYAYDCRTTILYSVENSNLKPSGFSERPTPVTSEQAELYNALLCN